MIKDLISELAYDRISLTQALTRAKILAYKIKNEELKDWLSGELNGYKNHAELPSYRIVDAETVGIVRSIRGENEIPIGIGENLKQRLNFNTHTWHINESIDSIENVLNKDKNANFLYVMLSPEFTEDLIPLIEVPYGTNIRALYKKIGVTLYYFVLIQTKQRLLDTLLELDSVFPDLVNDFNPITMQKDVSQIINNHIYGSNNNTNVGVGERVEQTQNVTINQNAISEIAEQLKTLKVPVEEVAIFEEIAKEPVSKESKSQKLLNWVGEVAKKAIEKGIDLQIPAIIDLIQRTL